MQITEILDDICKLKKDFEILAEKILTWRYYL